MGVCATHNICTCITKSVSCANILNTWQKYSPQNSMHGQTRLGSLLQLLSFKYLVLYIVHHRHSHCAHLAMGMLLTVPCRKSWVNSETKGSTLNMSSDSIKYKCLVLAVKHGSVILCGKGRCFSVRGRHLCIRMKFFLGMLKIGLANVCINKLIWSGLTTMYYSLHSFYLWILYSYYHSRMRYREISRVHCRELLRVQSTSNNTKAMNE